MRIVLTEKAIGDLIRIGKYIRNDNPERASTFVTELERCCLRLEDTPRGYPLVPRHEAEGIRRRPYGDYLIFYKLDEAADLIEVLHVLHGAQDWERIIFPQDP